MNLEIRVLEPMKPSVSDEWAISNMYSAVWEDKNDVYDELVDNSYEVYKSELNLLNKFRSSI